MGATGVGLLTLVAAGVLVGGCVTQGDDPAPPTRTPTTVTSTFPRPVPTETQAATVRPEPTPCSHNRLRKYVFVSIRRQHLWMCARHRVVRETPVTTGMLGRYTHTPIGTFRIEGRNRNTTLTLNTGATYPVRYWIPFDAPLFGFHDSPWQRFAYGSPAYRTRGSHGCVHVPLAAIRFLYRWVDIGTTVRIKA